MEKIPLGTTSTQATSTDQKSPGSFAQKLKEEQGMTIRIKKYFVPILVGMVVLGIGTGYVVASATTTQVIVQDTSEIAQTQEETGQEVIKVGQVFGAKDASAFKDSAEGVLLVGGMEGEGSHHIARPGGKSQNVYLTSSVVDLQLFENARVKVSGETFKAQKAGWLMDVGRVEILELNADLPDGTQAQPEDLMGDE